MFGLIKKDLLMIKSNIKLIAVMLLIFTLMAFNGETNLSFVPAMISIMIFMSTFSYDEYNKWDSYAITFPGGREKIVKSKYAASLLLVLAAIVITLILSVVVGVVNDDLNVQEIFSTMGGCVFAMILIISIMFPLIFKFGIEKGRIAIFVGVFAMAFLGSFVASMVNINISSQIMTFFNNYGLILCVIFAIGMLFISYKISRKVYIKKEF